MYQIRFRKSKFFLGHEILNLYFKWSKNSHCWNIRAPKYLKIKPVSHYNNAMVRLFYKYKASNRKYVAGKWGQIKVTGWVLFITFYVVVGPLFFARMYSVSHLYAVKPLSKWMASLAWHSMLCFILGGSFVHSGQKCFPWLACLWSEMPMFQRKGMMDQHPSLLIDVMSKRHLHRYKLHRIF